MRARPHHTVIAAIREAVEAWRKRDRLSIAAVVDNIVETHHRLGLDLSSEIKFELSDRDAHRRMQTNGERVYRWLDDFSKTNNHLPANFLPSVLAALPLDLRIQAVDSILLPAGLSVRQLDDDADSQTVCGSLQTLAKESGEAVASVAALVDGATQEELCKAQKEITEAIGAHEHTLHLVEKMMGKVAR